jgi:phage-related tail fiber protein
MIKILRSQVTNTPPSLAAGQLAYSEASSTLFFGLHDGTVLAIGGPGLFATKTYVDDAIDGIEVGVTDWGEIEGTLTDQEDLAAALALLAPLDSAALTGNPTAPTQASGNSSTRIATTAFVAAAVAALVNSAPGTLDTLKELADAIGDDADFAATITALVGEKLAKASNLSDLTDAGDARDNLGLGALAVLDDVDDGTF